MNIFEDFIILDTERAAITGEYFTDNGISILLFIVYFVGSRIITED